MLKEIQHQNLDGKLYYFFFAISIFFSFVLRSKNDHLITADDHVKLEVTGETVKLIISEVAPSDAGTYELVAENGLGSVDSTARMTVHCMSIFVFD